jgi:hypothetical protein
MSGGIMSLVSVYAIEVYDNCQDDFVPARGMATVESAKKEGWRIIQTLSIQVDSSLLNERGRYHPPQSPI